MAHPSSSVFTSVSCLKNCSHHMEFSEGEISSCQQVEKWSRYPSSQSFLECSLMIRQIHAKSVGIGVCCRTGKESGGLILQVRECY